MITTVSVHRNTNYIDYKTIAQIYSYKKVTDEKEKVLQLKHLLLQHLLIIT